jgi:hypothetical protein
MRQVPLAFVLVFLMSGCETSPEALGVDILSQATGEQVVFATTECVSTHPDGVQCNKKTCKADETSDCKQFANACLDSGHHYAGTSEGGACSRVL